MTEREKLIDTMAKAIWPNFYSEMHFQAVSDALTALEAAGVRLVPVEATEWMIMGATSRSDTREQAKPGDLYRDIYTAMLAASPYAPEAEG